MRNRIRRLSVVGVLLVVMATALFGITTTAYAEPAICLEVFKPALQHAIDAGGMTVTLANTILVLVGCSPL